MQKKTIFITISQALLIRNILRSGGFELLRQSDFAMVIFLYCKEVPEYIQKEFSGEDITLIPMYHFSVSRLHHWFILFTHFLIWNKTMKRYFRYGKGYLEKSRVTAWLYLLLLRICSSIPALKKFVRWAEALFFDECYTSIEKYFDDYKPDIVFSTSITSKMDIPFLKAGKRRGIPTVTMPKSWDNVTKMYFRFIPDYFLVQNEYLKDRLVILQNVPSDRIIVVGFPQFDWYVRKDIIRSREEHLTKMGLDPKLPLIFFGSQGIWYDKDYTIAEKIYEWIETDALVKPCQMLVRPHFTNVKSTPFNRFKHKPRVAFDDSYHISDVFVDNWDPLVPEMIDFANTLYHTDVMVIILSTLALDGACFDKPIINTLFGAKYRGKEDVTPYMPYTEHYSWVLETEGTTLAHSFEQLKEALNMYLLDSKIKAKERTALRERVCYKVDGLSSKRMVDALEHILKSYQAVSH